MAIYTNYGRYIKAKEFKNSIDIQGDTYLLLGIGNPLWDSTTDDTVAKMPTAPYNTSVMTQSDADTNQFYDPSCNQVFLNKEGATLNKIETVVDSTPISSTYMSAVKNVIAPFPCTWGGSDTIYESTSNTGQSISLDDYALYYLDSNSYMCKYENGGNISQWSSVEVMPTGDEPKHIMYRQVYADLYLRGKAIEAGIKHPSGLLGAVKCTVNFVKDIGSDDSVYTGAVNQIWYGDRFWEIINGDPLEKDTVTEADYEDLPHHLLFNATINPMQLCSELKIDQNIVPRHISICVKHSDTESANYYPVNETNVFNFGQYTAAELENLTGKTILNFTAPVTVGDNVYSNGDFKLILNDYIRGGIRDVHSVDRIGYIVGF